MYFLILVAGIPVWFGRKKQLVKALLRVAKLRNRFPLLSDLRKHLELPPGEEAEWHELEVYTMDEGRPVKVEKHQLTPMGRIAT